jgi:hypothetical protein
LGHTIPKIPYFSITSVDMPNNPSAVAAQPRHQPCYKVVMFFITHTSIGRVSNFRLQVEPISAPFGTKYPNILYFLITLADNPNEPTALATQPRHHPGYKIDMFF